MIFLYLFLTFWSWKRGNRIYQITPTNWQLNSMISMDKIYVQKLLFLRSIPETITYPRKILKYMFETSHDALRNLAIVLRILLTIPVTIASAEHSFSKLKFVITYLRSTMTSSCLSSLALIPIENYLSFSLDFVLIDTFASLKASPEKLLYNQHILTRKFVFKNLHFLNGLNIFTIVSLSLYI